MRRVVLVAAGVIAIAAVLLITFGGEKVEHFVSPETGELRYPNGEWVASVPGRRAELWAIGDAGGEGSRDVARLIERARPDRMLYLGDVYPRGSVEDFDAWARDFRALLDITAPTPGNHDWGEAVDGYEPFWREVTGETPPTFYSFRAGGWKVISVNSEHSDREATEKWLEDQVAPGGNCRVVFWHRPRFSAGPRGDSKAVQEPWEAISGRARMLLSGHEHDMQRLAPNEGIVQFVAGAGGVGHHDVNDADPRVRFSDSTHDGALRLTLEPRRARWQFVAVGGRVLDSGSLTCRP